MSIDGCETYLDILWSQQSELPERQQMQKVVVSQTLLDDGRGVFSGEPKADQGHVDICIHRTAQDVRLPEGDEAFLLEGNVLELVLWYRIAGWYSKGQSIEDSTGQWIGSPSIRLAIDMFQAGSTSSSLSLFSSSGEIGRPKREW